MMKKTRTRTKSASEGSYESGRRLVNANNLRRRVDLTGLSSKEREAFYAGAKFDTVPENAVIPVPPIKWIMQEGVRSQSSPSSPITVSGNGNKGNPSSLSPSPSLPIKLDLESLFGTKRQESTDFGDSRLGQLLKTASGPDRRGSMMELSHQQQSRQNGISASSSGTVTPTVVVKPLEPVVAKQPVTPTPSSAELMKKVSGISGKDLMGLLKSEPSGRQGQVREFERQRPLSATKFVSPRSCQFEFDHADSVDSHQYKDITNHLKSILKVSITAS